MHMTSSQDRVTAFVRLILALVVGLVCGKGLPVVAQHPTLTVTPDRAFYRPGEPVTLRVTADAVGQVEGVITYLAEPLAVIDAELVDGQAALTWQPPDESPRGYGVEVRLVDGEARASTAFDVLEHWIQAPRYGFLSQFAPGRDDVESTLDALLPYHVNGLQFYDWQYRHAELMPPSEPYADALGRLLSLDTVNRLIDAAHARNVAAMPYTAIYGASPEFYARHPDWALLDASGEVFDFADGFLKIMNPAPDSPWTDHLMDQFAQVLEQTAFDGIHLDQYGAPKIGTSTTGERVDLAEAFPGFIDRMAAVVDAQRGDEGVSIFNAVGNWPVETVAPSAEDAVYIEVWAPYTRFADLHRIVVNAQALGGGKPVIIAAYIHPDRAANVRLANALIFASGGYHLELGEPDAMLADPYFPHFGLMSDEMQAVMARYYDFLVRYENILALGTSDATGARAAALTIEGVKTTGLRSEDRLMVIVRQGEGFETFGLVNLMGIGGSRWDQPVHAPEEMAELRVHLAVARPVARLWWASPDGDDPALRALPFTAEEDGITFTLPALAYWDLLWVEYGTDA